MEKLTYNQILYYDKKSEDLLCKNISMVSSLFVTSREEEPTFCGIKIKVVIPCSPKESDHFRQDLSHKESHTIFYLSGKHRDISLTVPVIYSGCHTYDTDTGTITIFGYIHPNIYNMHDI